MKRSAFFLLGCDGVVREFDLRVESVCEHPLVVFDNGICDLDVLQMQTRKLGDVTVVPSVQARANDIDQLDGATLPSP